MRFLRYLAIGFAAILLLAVLGAARFSYISTSYEPSTVLPIYDKAIIYCGHAAMVAGGFVAGYPEVAQEAFYMHIPGPKEQQWQPEFPSRSPRVQKHVEALEAQVRSGASNATSRVAWTHYTPANQRYALALNPLSVEAERSNGKIHYRGTVECSYPEDALIRIHTGLGINIPLNEGLYRALEKAGWLHPYDAVWVWSEPL